MPNDRLTGLDASFLHLENDGAHMHVAGVMTFAGDPPDYDELVETVEQRLHLVPRYRQKLAFVPLGQGRPKWVDDPHLNLRYHIRRTALPAPGSEEQLRNLAGRVFSQPLDRDKPLWELWLVEGLAPDESGPRFAALSKTHHALVDGISGVDIVSVLFDTSPDPEPPARERSRWLARPEPAQAHLLVEALLERATMPGEVVRSLRAVVRGPRRVAHAAGESLVGLGAMAWAGLRPPPSSPYNTRLGPHRRFAWVRTSLDDVKAVKNALGGTVNDVVLAIVTGALRRHLERRGEALPPALRAMVPVSVRAEAERGALGNRVAAMMAVLPVRRGRRPDAARAGQRVDEGREALGAGGRRAGAHRPERLRPAHGHEPGRAPDLHAALLQPRGDERARPAAPALPDGPRADRHLPDGPAGQGAGARRGDHELQRPHELRPAWATTTRWPTSTSWPTTSRSRWPSWRTPPA